VAVAFDENGSASGDRSAGQLRVGLFEQALELVCAGGPGVIFQRCLHFSPQEWIAAQTPATGFVFEELGT